jgi:PAS domain S-box-containing protein
VTAAGNPAQGDEDGIAGDLLAPDALLRAVLETSADAIFAIDGRGRIRTWSAACERLFGHQAGRVIDQDLGVFFPEHLHAEVSAVTARALAGEYVRQFETELLRPEGLPALISLSISPVAGGGLVVVVRDTTEQRLAQAALAEAERRLEESEALAHVGSWLWDVRTGAVQWSTEFHRFHGVDPLSFDGTFESHLAVVHPDDRDRVRVRMEGAVATGRPFEDEYRIVRPDGEQRLMRVRAQPALGSDGTAVGLRGSGHDVTDN